MYIYMDLVSGVYGEWGRESLYMYMYLNVLNVYINNSSYIRT